MSSDLKDLQARILALGPTDQAKLLNMLRANEPSSPHEGAGADHVSEPSGQYGHFQGRNTMQHSIEHLLQKLAGLPTTLQAEVEDFIDFLHQREQQQSAAKAVTKISESAFNKIWDNDEDAAYDKL